jgi:hypothetical protein
MDLMSGSLASRILAGGIVAFVGLVSGVLVWSGLAASPDELADACSLRRARARLVVGVIGFGLALWAALGMLTRAW